MIQEDLSEAAHDYVLKRLKEEFPNEREGAIPGLAATHVSAASDPETRRTRVKLKLWKLRTMVDVEINAETGELMAWRDAALGREQGSRSITESEAIETAKAALAPLPEDAGSADVYLKSLGKTRWYEVTWVHLVGPDGDVVVEGDRLLARVNATTGKVTSVFKKWRIVGETPPAE